jgi:hypothetical protein
LRKFSENNFPETNSGEINFRKNRNISHFSLDRICKYLIIIVCLFCETTDPNVAKIGNDGVHKTPIAQCSDVVI